MAQPTSLIIATTSAISSLVDLLVTAPNKPPSLYLDLEGVNLSRHGSISILQLLFTPTNTVYLLDITTLGATAFTTPGTQTKETLRAILESASIAKVFFDVRNDSDALHAHYGIKLAGVHDIQLMENATRSRPKRYLSGLGKCIEYDNVLSASEKAAWQACKNKGLNLFAPERGGCYEVFNKRPIPQAIVEYCVADVRFMPSLYEKYEAKLTAVWRGKVESAVAARIAESQAAKYTPNGEHKKYGPWP